MPAPSRKTPQRIAQMIAMHREGASAREIAGELHISGRAVGLWLVDAGLQPNGGHGSRKGRKRRPLDETSKTIADIETEIMGGPVAHDRDSALAHAQRRLAQLEKIVDVLTPGIQQGTGNASQWSKVLDQERQCRTEIAQLAPIAEPDPEKDPANLEAAAIVERKMAGLVEAARRTAKCLHCGKNPFSEVRR